MEYVEILSKFCFTILYAQISENYFKNIFGSFQFSGWWEAL